MLKQLYAGKEEVKKNIDAMGDDYDREQIKKELKALAARIREEIMFWKNRIGSSTGLESVLSKGKNHPQLNKSIKGRNNLVG